MTKIIINGLRVKAPVRNAWALSFAIERSEMASDEGRLTQLNKFAVCLNLLQSRNSVLRFYYQKEIHGHVIFFTGNHN